MLTPFMLVVQREKPEGLDDFIKSSLLSKFFEMVWNKGWGNGYVAVSKGHPWYGLDMFELSYRITSRSSITFSNFGYLKHPSKLRSSVKKFWIIGFDTMHAGDTPENWTKDDVIDNTLDILVQAMHEHSQVQPYTRNHRKLFKRKWKPRNEWRPKIKQ